MKKLILLLSIIAGLESAKAQNIDIDSLFYSGIDTTGLAKEIAFEEANYHWTDTIEDGKYDAIDRYSWNLKKVYTNIPDLADDLTFSLIQDDEKVRAIFIWISKNILYDEIGMKNTKVKTHIKFNRHTPDFEIEKEYEKFFYNYATNVLCTKRGICEGYATLFYELCSASGIPCEIVYGYANDNPTKINKYKRRKNFPANHSWNKVLIGEEWLHLDVTWASTGWYNGKITESIGVNLDYYLVPETKLYPDHIINIPQSERRNELVGNY